MKGNTFLGIDENLDMQSSISIESEKFDDCNVVEIKI